MEKEKLYTMEDLETVAGLAVAMFKQIDRLAKNPNNPQKAYKGVGNLVGILHKTCGLEGWCSSKELRALIALVTELLDTVSEKQALDTLEEEEEEEL